MSDQRLNKSSGSKFSIDAACPGNQNLVQSLTDEQRAAASPDDPLALRGTKLHAAWEKDSIEDLEEDEIEDFEKGRKYVESAIAQWAQDNQLSTFTEAEREQRFWLHSPDTLEPVVSGQLDKYLTSGRHAIILDFKSGWVQNLIPSHHNWQLRVYAVLLWREHPELERIRVGFVKPKAKAEAADYTDYTVDDLEHSEREIFHVLWKNKQPDAQRVAGPWCNFCVGKAYCDQAAAMSLLPTTIVRSLTTRELTPEEIASFLTPEDLVAVWTRSGTIVKILEAIKDRLKGLPAEEQARLGVTLADGRKMENITQTKACFDYCVNELKLTEAELWQAASLNKTDLVKAIQRDIGVSKEKALGLATQLREKFGTKTFAEKSLKRL